MQDVEATSILLPELRLREQANPVLSRSWPIYYVGGCLHLKWCSFCRSAALHIPLFPQMSSPGRHAVLPARHDDLIPLLHVKLVEKNKSGSYVTSKKRRGCFNETRVSVMLGIGTLNSVRSIGYSTHLCKDEEVLRSKRHEPEHCHCDCGRH